MTKTITAAEAVKACLEEIRTARLKAGDAAAAKQQALQDSRAAAVDRDAALEANARGEADAVDRFKEANDRLHEAEQRLEVAEAQDHACLRVIRSAEARLSQTRQTHLKELADDIEREFVSQVVEAAEKLAEPLKEYQTAFNQAAAAYQPLGPAIHKATLADDLQKGRSRDQDKIYAQARVPPCPLPVNAADLVRTVMPRPRFLNKND